MSAGGDAKAAAFVECQIGERVLWGVGIDANIVRASLKAVLSAAVEPIDRPPVSEGSGATAAGVSRRNPTQGAGRSARLGRRHERRCPREQIGTVSEYVGVPESGLRRRNPIEDAGRSTRGGSGLAGARANEKT